MLGHQKTPNFDNVWPIKPGFEMCSSHKAEKCEEDLLLAYSQEDDVSVKKGNPLMN